MDGLTVVKVGGSLFDLPDLGPRLRRFLDGRGPVLLVPGGGPTADVVRQWDQRHQLGEEAAHWLALRALSLNAHFLASLVPDAVVVHTIAEGLMRAAANQRPVLDGHAFAQSDEGQPGSLPHRWAVTSDSLAARVAAVARARQLILLKSVPIAPHVSWAEAGRRGWVDPYFAPVLEQADGLAVLTINLRD